MRRPFFVLVALVLAAALSSGCVTLFDPESSQEFGAEVVAAVDTAHVVGQTFVVRRPRLNGVELWLRTSRAGQTASPGVLTVELFRDPEEKTSVASVNLAVTPAFAGYPARVLFLPQDDPPGQQYYLQLRATGSTINVLGRNEDTYTGGKAFLDGKPIDADLAFRLLYDYDSAAILSDLLSAVPHAWLTLPLAALLILPGWVLLELFNLREHFDGGEQIALAAGLSMAVVSLLLLWTSCAGLRWSRPAVVVVAVLLAGLALWLDGSRRRSAQHRQVPAQVHPQTISGCNGWRWALAGVFILSFAVRLVMVRDLAAPAWVDSVHHALIARLIMDEGALPQTYAPFVVAETANYHAGFHAVVATFSWLSGLDVGDALLLVGQLLSALMVLPAYLLAREMSGDRTTGIVAALVVGVFSPMPAYYVSWGRYTHLAGLFILPTAATLTCRGLHADGSIQRAIITADGNRKWYLILASVALGGLLFTHYRIAAFYGCFVLAYLTVQRCRRSSWGQHLADDALRLGAIAGAAMVLTLPWLIPTLTTLWWPKLQAWGNGDPSAYLDFSWAYLTPGLGKYVLASALIGLAWGLLHRQRFALTLTTWVGLLFLLASPGLVGLPGAGFVNFVSVEISLFLPLSILAGYTVSQFLALCKRPLLRRLLPMRWKVLYQGALALLAVGAALYGARTILPILNPVTVLYRQADERAMAWIQENTSSNARFLINPMTWYPQTYAGHDGGYWIAPLANRRTVPPPALYGLGSRTDIVATNRICSEVIRNGDEPEALWPRLREEGITHIYIGARGGVLSPKALAESAHYRAVYSQDSTWVFEVLP